MMGSLQEMNVVDLIRLPLTGQKTGEMILAGLSSEARLYYVNGRLVHARVGELAGQDALAEILGWEEGEFEFRTNVLTDEASIDAGLDQAISGALKAREQHGRETAAEGGPASLVTGDPAEMQRLLEELVRSQDFVQHASIFDGAGAVAASASGQAGEPKGVAELRSEVCRLAGSYPRGQFHRICLEDDHGVVVVACTPNEGAVVVVADRGARPGAVTMCVDRFLRRLAEVEQKTD